MSGQGEVGGRQRVAALLLSLEPDVAKSVLSTLSDDVVTEVAQAMVDLDPRLADPEAIDDLMRDLAVEINGRRKVRSCEEGELAGILAESIGHERSKAVIHEIQDRRRKARPFSDIEPFAASVISRVLREESPAVVALVLSFLDPQQSADVLKTFEDEAALDAITRMATLDPPGQSVLVAIAHNLAERMAQAQEDGEGPDASGRLRSIAEVLKFSSPTLEKGVIEGLAEEDQDAADELREYMFTWNDIADIDKRSMQKILGTVDTKTLSIALKACSAEVEENVLNNLSTRVRQMVADERELAGALPMSEVKAARDEIMKNIRGLIEAGEFQPTRSGEELVS